MTNEIRKKKIAKMLGELNPLKPLGSELFNQMARYSWTIAFEAVFLRKLDGILKVYLIQRALNDTAYPGEWHIPGTVFRPIDNGPTDAGKRLAQSEFGVPQFSFIKEVGKFFNNNEARGPFLSLIYLVELNGEPKTKLPGKWFFVNLLPKETSEHHQNIIIPMAVKAFETGDTIT